MKMIATIALIGVSFTTFSQGSMADTTIRNVRISFHYSRENFPVSWQSIPINATGEQIASSETQRSKAVLVKALRKYPATALEKDLSVVYFLKSMKFYEVEYGGTNSTDALFLTNNGIAAGYNDLYLEQTFHHEFSSILYRNYPSFMVEDDWKNANIHGFDYNDPENGVGAIRNNQSSQELDTILCKKGFLTQYSLSGMENDINTFAQNIFSPSAGFWEIVDQYPRIKMKVLLLIEFYNRIDSFFTEDYFRNLNSNSQKGT